MSYFQEERGGRVHLGLAAKAGVVYTVRVDDYKNKGKGTVFEKRGEAILVGPNSHCLLRREFYRSETSLVLASHQR